MRLLPALLLTAACVPPIVVPPASAVARTERRAREVTLCRLEQERDVRPRFEGVDELSFAPWEFTIASVAVRHPAGRGERGRSPVSSREVPGPAGC